MPLRSLNTTEKCARADHFPALVPQDGVPSRQDFHLGLQISSAQDFANIESWIISSFEAADIIELEASDRAAALKKQRDILISLKEQILRVPGVGRDVSDSWLEQWIQRYFDHFKAQHQEDDGTVTSLGDDCSESLSPIIINTDHTIRGKEGNEGSQQKSGMITDPLQLFKERLEKASLDQMVLEVRVFHSHNIEVAETAQLSASRFLEPGKDHVGHLAKNYSFELFTKEFQRKINTTVPEHPLDMKHGRFSYIKHNHDLQEVTNQEDFEIAINYLYLFRGMSHVLTFHFQSETQDTQTKRLMADIQPANSISTEMVYKSQLSPTSSPGTSNSIDMKAERQNSKVGRWITSIMKNTEQQEIPAMYHLEPISPSRKTNSLVRQHDPSPAFRRTPFNSARQEQAKPPRKMTKGHNKSRIPVRTAETRSGTQVAGSYKRYIFPTIETSQSNTARDRAMALLEGKKLVETKPLRIDIAPKKAERPLSQSKTAMSPIDRGFRRLSKIIGMPESPESVLGTLVRGVGMDVPKAREESYVDRHARMKLLFREEGRASFKRGGIDETNPNLGKSQAVDGEHITDNAEGDEYDETLSHQDRLVMQLQALPRMPQLCQLHDPARPNDDLFRWKHCCNIFRLDPFKRSANERVAIAGLHTKLYQFQVFGVYWQMVKSRSHGGGFVADEMGLGKTLSFLAYIVVEKQLSYLWKEVKESRENHDRKHLQLNQHNENDACPSIARPGWIVCPCASSSPTSKIAPKHGVKLACVPPGLVKSWWAQWKIHVNTQEPFLGMTIVIAHPPSFDIKTSTIDRLSDARTPRNVTRLKAQKYSERYQDGKGDDTAKDWQDAYLVVTTRGSCPAWIKGFEYQGLIGSMGKHGKTEWKKGKRSGIVFGIGMIDEAHEEYTKGKGGSSVLLDLPHTSQPFIWGCSGTPISQTPRSLGGVLRAIEKHARSNIWEKRKSECQIDPNFRQFEYHKWDALCKIFDKQLKAKNPDTAAIEKMFSEFRPFLLNVMIRRTADTMWFDQPMIELNPHIHQDIRLSHRREFDEKTSDYMLQFQHEKELRLTELQDFWDLFPELRRTDARPTKLAFNTECRLDWRLGILTTFPWLVNLALKPPDSNDLVEFTIDELVYFRESDEKGRGSPYSRNIRNIVENSPKCLWLYYYITDMCKSTDTECNEQRLVIMSQYDHVAFILKLFIEEFFRSKKGRIGLIGARMRLKERTETIEAFMDAVNEKGDRKQRKNFQFLIGTTKLIGSGLQLTRACNFVLMEPDPEYFRELQGYARIHRIGQRSPISRSYRLIDVRSEFEKKILKRQEDRKEAAGRPLMLEEVERIEVEARQVAEPEELTAASPTNPSQKGGWSESTDVINQ